MTVNRAMVDSGELRHAAGLVAEKENAARAVAEVIGGVGIDLTPDDPMRTHRHFLLAFDEFVQAWSSEIGHVADAAGDLVTHMDVTAESLLHVDRQNGNKARSIVPSPR